jgi:phospholipid-binding lipoprotein MlaA
VTTSCRSAWRDRVRSTRSGPPLRRLAALLAVLLCFCLATPGQAQSEIRDPLEAINRPIFKFNDALDQYVLEPVARGYRLVTPSFVRTGIRNFLYNLRTPVTLANDMLQGEATRATQTIGRFMFNTILGFGGFVDVGGMLGMPERHFEDFGQTLAVYGVGSGPYLMLPLLGPSNPRDLAGTVVDLVFDPLTFVGPTEVQPSRRAADVVSFREANMEEIEEFRRTSLDLYAATRTLAIQVRQSEIRNGAPADLDTIYDEEFYDLDDPDEVPAE